MSTTGEVDRGAARNAGIGLRPRGEDCSSLALPGRRLGIGVICVLTTIVSGLVERSSSSLSSMDSSLSLLDRVDSDARGVNGEMVGLR